MEAAREAQGVDDEVDRRRLAGDHRALGGPIALELPSGLRLEADRRPPRPQRALGVEVIAQNGDPSGVPLRLEFPPDHHGVPGALGQQPIDDWPVGIQPAAPPAATRRRGSAAPECAPDRARVDPELPGDVTEIDTSLDQCLNHHEVLGRQHVPLLPDGPIGGGTFSLVVGGLPISVFSGLLSQALTGSTPPVPARSPSTSSRSAAWRPSSAPRSHEPRALVARGVSGRRLPGCLALRASGRRHRSCLLDRPPPHANLRLLGSLPPAPGERDSETPAASSCWRPASPIGKTSALRGIILGETWAYGFSHVVFTGNCSEDCRPPRRRARHSRGYTSAKCRELWEGPPRPVPMGHALAPNLLGLTPATDPWASPLLAPRPARGANLSS